VTTEQLPLGLDALLPICLCGCGRRVPSGTRGQTAQYATPACRVRAHRARASADVSELAVTPSRPPGELEDASTGFWQRCPDCSSGRHAPRCWLGTKPDMYVMSFGVGICPCCGYQPPRPS
jgi:hypothetical protein